MAISRNWNMRFHAGLDVWKLFFLVTDLTSILSLPWQIWYYNPSSWRLAGRRLDHAVPSKKQRHSAEASNRRSKTKTDRFRTRQDVRILLLVETQVPYRTRQDEDAEAKLIEICLGAYQVSTTHGVRTVQLCYLPVYQRTKERAKPGLMPSVCAHKLQLALDRTK